MIELLLSYLEMAGMVIKLFAVAVIFVGFALAAWRYARRWGDLSPVGNFTSFKVALGQALMLGLELLVLADVIETISSEPTFQSLLVLASIVVLRTIVSWTLFLEVEGRWPWQEQASD